MKNDPITKLYIGLTDKERAALAFNYAMQHNEVELCRIRSAMPMQHFTGLPSEYRQGLYNLQNLAMLYAIEYWRLVAHIQTEAAGAMVKLQSNDPDEWRPIVQQHKKREAELSSLEMAFENICQEHGLDLCTMRFMAGRQYYQVANPDLAQDADYLAGMREIFAGVMER